MKTENPQPQMEHEKKSFRGTERGGDSSVGGEMTKSSLYMDETVGE